MPGETERLEGGRLLVALSNAIVGVFRDGMGKGPSKCRTYWASDDILLVVLRGGYSAAEQTLYDSGRGRSVMNTRQALQETLEAKMTEAIEGLTGRTVVAFMSASHQDPDLSAELFMLEPEDDSSQLLEVLRPSSD